MKLTIKKIIILICYYSGLNWLVGKFMRDRVFCVGYHSIYGVENKEKFDYRLYKNISISTYDFEKQLLFLRSNGHSFIHFSDLKKKETKKLVKPTVIFFDDGFKDVAVNALPVLKKYNIPTTIFVTTGLIDCTHFMWTLGLRSFLFSKGKNEKEIEGKIKEFKKMPMIERENVLKNLYEQNNFVLKPENFQIFLDWQEVVELSKNGFEIGSHCISHQKLPELGDIDLEKEIAGSKRILEQKLGFEISNISYPYGRFNEKVEKIVEKSGYSLAVSTVSGTDSFESISNFPFRLKKISPEPDELKEFFKVKLYLNI